MAKLEDEHDYSIVFNAANEAVVFNAITPKCGQGAAQWLAETAGIFGDSNSLAQIFQDGLLRPGPNLRNSRRAVVEFDCPVPGIVRPHCDARQMTGQASNLVKQEYVK